jgi:DNA-binding transcriptional regulator YdaS (Cro superfamily)
VIMVEQAAKGHVSRHQMRPDVFGDGQWCVTHCLPVLKTA